MTQVKLSSENAPSEKFHAPPAATSPSSDARGSGLLLVPVAVSLALYLRTVAPDMLPGDPGEFQFAAWRLGLAHATGYPFYLILGWAWQHALTLFSISPAAALNALSALAASAGVGLLGLLMARWTRPALGDRAAAVAIYSAVLLAVNLTYWSQALIAEVYTLQVVLMLLLWLAVRQLTEETTTRRLLGTALLTGLALTHHAMSLLLIPALAVYWHLARTRPLPWRVRLTALPVAALPLLLYLYIPLRSGPDASPWYHQPLGDGVLQLYSGGWDAFVAFISGRSISVGFRDVGDAWQQIGQAAWLWHYHFGWVGLVMMALGLAWLAATGRRAILIATVLYVLLQQGFNLFYNIGDILVYYIPLYMTGAMWAGFGLAGLISGQWRRSEAGTPPEIGRAAALVGWVAAGALILMAVREAPATVAAIDQSDSRGARTRWEAILAAAPPPESILISNDRDEIVPLFYLQAVEGRGQGVTGLFPLIAPDARFRDIGATVATALDAAHGGPVYLIKPMPGLDIRFALEPGPDPLVRVGGPAATAPPTYELNAAFGPLRLLGIDINTQPEAGQIEVAVHWRVEQPIDDNYTATVQWLTGDDVKLAQHDLPAGGVYYPTSLWKPGERLVVRHTLIAEEAIPPQTRLLIGMYRAADLTPLAPPIHAPLDEPPP